MARKIIYIAGGLVVLVLVVAVLLPSFIDANKFKPQIDSAAESALARKVQTGNIHLSLLSGGVTVENVSIGEDPKFGAGPFLTAKSLVVGIEWMPLIFSRQIQVTGITIDQPELSLIRDASGTWNFSSLGAKGAAPAAPSSPPSSGSVPSLSVQRIEIKNGTLIVGDMSPGTKPHEYNQVNVTASNLSYTSQFPFEFSATTPGNGSIKLDGKAGPLNRNDAAETPLDTSLEIRSLDLAATGFMGPTSGIAGVLDFTGRLSSDGQQLSSNGKITANRLKLVPGGSPAGQPLQVDYATNYNLKSQTGSLQQGDVHIGKAIAHLTGTFDNSGKTPSVDMKLNGSEMPASDLQSVLPALGVTLPSGASLQQGTMNVDLAITGPVNQSVASGPVKLSNAKLAGFNLGEKLGSLSSFAGVPKGTDTVIETFSSDLRLAPEGIRLDNLNLVVPSIGTLTGSGTVAADQALDFQMAARLSGSNSPAGQIASFAEGGQNGRGIPFKIQGTTSKPEFVPNVGAIASGLAKGAMGAAPVNGQSLGKQLGGLFGKKK